MRSLVAIASLGLGWLVCAAGCGSSPSATSSAGAGGGATTGAGTGTGTTSNTSTGGGSQGGTCTAFAQAVCEGFGKCFPYYVETVWGDIATCTSREELLCANEVAAPGSSEGSDLAACSLLLSNMECDGFLSGVGQCALSPGALAKGAACGEGAQCASGYCHLAVGTNCGTCDDNVPAGGSCANAPQSCAKGTVCDPTKTCTAPIPNGGSCTSTQSCGTFYVCNNGTCGLGAMPGSPCGNGVICSPYAGQCDAKTNLCVAFVAVAPGQPCGAINDQHVGCQALGKCTIAQGMTTGVCEAAAADGAACGGNGGPSCLTPAACENGVCTVPDPASCK